MKKAKYDFIVSVGRDCACSTYLRKHNLQRQSYPLDWLTHDASLDGCLDIRFELILNEFKDFMNIEDFRLLPQDPNVLNDNNCDYYQNISNSLYFYHDFAKGTGLEQSFPAAKDKYERRIKRFYQKIDESQKVLFVWFSHQPNISDDMVIEYSKKINAKFNKTIDIVIFENNKNYPVKDKFDNVQLTDSVTKYILNTYPEGVQDKTQGNIELCDKVFKLYALNETFKEIASNKLRKIRRKSKKALINAICIFVPIKSWRKAIRSRKNV